MLKRACCLLLLATTPLFSLSLQEAVQKGLSHNRDLKGLYQAENAQQFRLFSEHARFDWQWFVQALAKHDEIPASSQLQGANVSIQNNAGATLGLQKPISDGSLFKLTLNSNRQSSNSRFAQVNPVFSSDIALQYTVPLLKNRGRVARFSLLMQRTTLDLATLNLIQSARELVFQVQSAYLDAVFAKANVALAERELKLAQDFLSDTQARIDAGLLAPTEVFAAQARLAAARRGLTQAQGNYTSALDRLSTLLGGEAVSEVTFEFEKKPPQFDVEELVREGLAQRVEIDIAQAKIAQAKTQLLQAANEKKPQLDLDLSLGFNGVKGTQVSSLQETFDVNFMKWQVGLQLSQPFGNNRGVNLSKAAEHELEQAKLSLQQAKLTVSQEVRQAFIQYTTAVKALEDARAQEKYSEKLYATEEEKLKEGLSTPFLVEQANKEYFSAQVATLQAKVALHKALFALERAIGARRRQFEEALKKG